MRPFSMPGDEWRDVLQEAREESREQAEGILRSITQSVDQVNLATEFFLLREDPRQSGPELQLACLIKDRIARIEEQVSELYRIMSRGPGCASPVIQH